MTKLEAYLERRQREEIILEDISGDNSVLLGGTANLLLAKKGNDVILIDSGQMKAASKIRKAIGEKLEGDRVTTIINTHCHSDHIENNDGFGDDIRIIAHENVLGKLVSGGGKYEDGAPVLGRNGFPNIVFDSRMELRYGDDAVELVHYERCHSDSDVAVYLPGSGILHTGDLFTNGYFPFLDNAGGGNLYAWHAAIEEILGRIDRKTIIVPGHGPVGTKADLVRFSHMLTESIRYFEECTRKGCTAEEVQGLPMSNLLEHWVRDPANKVRWIDNGMENVGLYGKR